MLENLAWFCENICVMEELWVGWKKKLKSCENIHQAAGKFADIFNWSFMNKLNNVIYLTMPKHIKQYIS